MADRFARLREWERRHRACLLPVAFVCGYVFSEVVFT